jgi:uncharacterized protein YkwD
MPVPAPARRALRGHLSHLAVVAVLVLLTAGCGGGGGGPTAPSSGPGVASVEGSSFALINGARRGEGRPEVLFDPVLSEVARRHSERMRDEGFFAHDDPSGHNVASRVRSAGVVFSIVGENLATTSGTTDPAREAHGALMGNAQHRANILDGRFTLAGVGVARSGNSYWITQVFVRP